MPSPFNNIDALARDLQPQRHPLAVSLERATRAVGFAPHEAVHPATSMAPADILIMRMSDGAAAAVNGHAYDRSAMMRPAGEIDTLRGRIMAASRVCRAGAVLVPVADERRTYTSGNGSGDAIGYSKNKNVFTVIDAPKSTVVADGADAPLTPESIFRTEIDLPEAASHALHFKISRADFRERDADLQAFELSRSIALGIARIADEVLLKALAALSLTAFTLAKAAAKNVAFDQLRALIGTSATGAAVGADGVLRAGGVAGDLTSEITQTIIGAFPRAGVAVEDEIRVVSRRTNIQGSLEIVVYVNAQPLVPDAGAFWLGA